LYSYGNGLSRRVSEREDLAAVTPSRSLMGSVMQLANVLAPALITATSLLLPTPLRCGFNQISYSKPEQRPRFKDLLRDHSTSTSAILSQIIARWQDVESSRYFQLQVRITDLFAHRMRIYRSITLNQHVITTLTLYLVLPCRFHLYCSPALFSFPLCLICFSFASPIISLGTYLRLYY